MVIYNKAIYIAIAVMNKNSRTLNLWSL